MPICSISLFAYLILMDTKNGNGLQNNPDFPKKVGIAYSEVKREYFPTEAQYLTEKDARRDAEKVAACLHNFGIKVFLYAGDPDELMMDLKKDEPDMVINLVDSIKGQEYLSSAMPGIFEALDMPYTGVGILGRSLDYNKFLVKDLLQSHGIPVPRFQLLSSVSSILDPHLRFPLISKLNEIHGAVEITADAVSPNEKHLRDRLKYLIKTYEQPALVEEFIAGREITAIMLEGKNKKVYLGEKIFTDGSDPMAFVTFADQWLESGKRLIRYEKFNDPQLVEYVRKAFDVLRLSDYAKFDIRLDQSGRYFFIDSNSNPALGPKEVDCAMGIILDLYGIKFSEIMRRLLLNTMLGAQGKEALPPVDAPTN